MQTTHLLRRQVSTEIKRRRYVVYTLLLLSILYLGATLLFNESGAFRYYELRQKEALAEHNLNAIIENNNKLKTQIDSFEGNDFYLEKYAREEYGLAGPREYIFIYKK